MPISEAASSSSESPGRAAADPEDSVPLCCFATGHGPRAFFVYGFAKSSRKNLRRDELIAFRVLADEMLGLTRAGLSAAQANGTIIEVPCDD